MAFSIKALKYMQINSPVPGCGMFFQEKFEQMVEVCGYFYLVRGEGLNIVVDTGMGLPPGPEGPKRQMFGEFCVEPGCDTTSLLAAEGVRPEDVDLLVLTHLHTDHCWNASLFPNATIHFSKAGWQAVVESPRHPALYPDAIYPQRVYKHFREEAWERVVLMPAEHEVVPGITTYWVGGHSPCSHIVRVQTGSTDVVFAGDNAFYYANVEENIPVAYFVSLAECYEALDRIRSFPGIVVPTHDPEILKRHPGGVIVS